MDCYKSLMIGDKAPHFKADTTYGMINFPEDYKGKWVIFFSHPNDFTPVCTTEILTFASMQEDYEHLNCKLLGLSIDSNPSHIEWCKKMETYTLKDISHQKIGFPIVADDMGEVAKTYGMLMPSASTSKTVRSVFYIDPDGIIRAILVYPLTTGRNMEEIKRLLKALQEYDKTGCPTPADWVEGEKTIIPPPKTLPEVYEKIDSGEINDCDCIDWYLCFNDEKTKSAEKKRKSEDVENKKSSDKIEHEVPHNIPTTLIDMTQEKDEKCEDTDKKEETPIKKIEKTSTRMQRTVYTNTFKGSDRNMGIMEQNRSLYGGHKTTDYKSFTK